MSRSISIDSIKALSIFGVVYIHASGLFDCSSVITTTLSQIFRFSVPFFIIIWAYFLEKSYLKKTTTERRVYIYQRFKYLFIVYFAWSCIYFLFADKKDLTFIHALTKYFLGYGWAGQYYFMILFQLLVMYPLLRALMEHKLVVYICFLIICLMLLVYSYQVISIPTSLLKLGDRPFVFWVPYVFLGIALARNVLFKIPAYTLFLLLLIPVEFFYIYSNSEYLRISIYVAASLSCAYFIQNPITITSTLLGKAIQFVGENTLIIFVSNPLIILIIGMLNLSLYSWCSFVLFQVITPFIIVLIVMVSALALKFVIKKCGLTGVLF